MKNFFLKPLLLCLLSLSWHTAHAYDCEVDGIYYNLLENEASVTTYRYYDYGTYYSDINYDFNSDTKEAIVTYKEVGKAPYSGSVTIPSTVTYIGEIYRVTSIGECAFSDCSSLTSVTIPSCVTSIGVEAFAWCSHLTEISIPESVTSIGTNAFAGCNRLTSICIPNDVTSIGFGLFRGCTNLISIILPNNVVSIGNMAFYRCSSLTSITIPNNVTSIGMQAFEECSGLTSVVSKIEEPFVFDSGAFRAISSDCVLTVPYGTKDAYIAKGWTTDVFKGGIVEAPRPKCDTPTITLYANGSIKVECATEGAKCVTNITATYSDPLYMMRTSVWTVISRSTTSAPTQPQRAMMTRKW